MRILNKLPLVGNFTMVWTEQGKTVSVDLIAIGDHINLSKMPELGDLRQDVINSMPENAIIIVPDDGKILVEVDDMPTEGQFVAYWDANGQRWAEDWKIENDILMCITEDDWKDVDMFEYQNIDLKFGIWQ